VTDINGRVFVRRGGALVPADDHAREIMEGVKDGQSVMVSVRKVRNPRQHRLAWALAQKVSEAVEWLHDREDAMDYLKIKARHVRMIVDPRTGEVTLTPKSIAFASCPQETFNRLFDRMCWIICNEVVPGMDESALRAEVLALVDGEPMQRAA
jgi:hypothetical protein